MCPLTVPKACSLQTVDVPMRVTKLCFVYRPLTVAFLDVLDFLWLIKRHLLAPADKAGHVREAKKAADEGTACRNAITHEVQRGCTSINPDNDHWLKYRLHSTTIPILRKIEDVEQRYSTTFHSVVMAASEKSDHLAAPTLLHE